MNLVDALQDLVGHVPELVQPLIVAATGAIPFVEGEGAAAIGIVGGITPAIAIVAAIVGNFACVAVLVLLGSGARRAVVTRHRARMAATAGGPGAEPETGIDSGPAISPRRAKFQRAFERYGVPGVSLLGPLLLPTQFTATMLAAAGVGRARILIWQGVAIVGWTVAVALVVGGVVSTFG